MTRIAPPSPYDADGGIVWEYDGDTDSVVIPYWYWEMVFDYIADTQALMEDKEE